MFEDIIGKVEKIINGSSKKIKFEDIQHRIGRFSIANDVIIDSTDIVFKIFSDMIVIEANLNQSKGVIEYLAYSPKFDETYNVCYSDDAPLYEISWTANGTLIYRKISS